MTSGRTGRSRSREGRNRTHYSGAHRWGPGRSSFTNGYRDRRDGGRARSFDSRDKGQANHGGRASTYANHGGNNNKRREETHADSRSPAQQSMRIPRSQMGHGNNRGGNRYKSDGRKRPGEKAHRTRAQSEVSTSSHTSSKSSIVHFQWKPNMQLMAGMYVISQLGEGTFGRVLLVDYKGEKEAIKVIRDVTRYRKDAEIENRILQQIQKKMETTKHLSKGHDRIVRLLGNFTTATKPTHYCLAFETLGPSLYSVLKGNGFQGFYMEDLQTFAKQGLQALQFLEAIKLTHTDLKPENLLLKYEGLEVSSPPRKGSRNDSSTYYRPRRADLKIIDFGGATFESEHHSSTISTRQYRAPEVLLEAGWSTPADMFSFGCILMELYTGRLLLQTHECGEHLHILEKVIAPFHTSDLALASRNIQDSYLRRTKDKRWYLPKYDEDSSLPHSAVEAIRKAHPVHDLVQANHRSYAEFCKELLKISPKKTYKTGGSARASIL